MITTNAIQVLAVQTQTVKMEYAPVDRIILATRTSVADLNVLTIRTVHKM